MAIGEFAPEVGVPEIVPEDESRVTPEGKPPKVMDQVNVPTALAA